MITTTTTATTTTTTTASLLVALLALGAAGCGDKSTTATHHRATAALPTSAPVSDTQGKGGSGSGKSPGGELPAKGWPKDGEVIDCPTTDDLVKAYNDDVFFYRNDKSVQLVRVSGVVSEVEQKDRDDVIIRIHLPLRQGKIENTLWCDLKVNAKVAKGDKVTITGRLNHKIKQDPRFSMTDCQLSPR